MAKNTLKRKDKPVEPVPVDIAAPVSPVAPTLPDPVIPEAPLDIHLELSVPGIFSLRVLRDRVIYNVGNKINIEKYTPGRPVRLAIMQ